MTDKELQIELAKMLPEMINIGSSRNALAPCWAMGMEIADTEWLHVCHLVEQTLGDDNSLYGRVCYANVLMGICKTHAACVFASWQQRAQALVVVKSENK